jgi:hypothetical protein
LTNRESALELARLGLRVVPVTYPIDGGCSCFRGAKCEAPGKHPPFTSWQHLATIDAPRILEWWAKDAAANVGVVTGKGSGVFALDVDTRSGGDDSLFELEQNYGALPATWEIHTGGGGRHLLFAYPSGQTIGNRAGELAPGLDVRGERGLIVAPPSLHTSGRHYEWSVDGHPENVALSDAPHWLLALIARRQAKRREELTSAGRIPKTRRHNTLLALAGSMRHAGLSADAIEAALWVENRRCDPPFNPGENGGVESIAKSAAAWPVGPAWQTDLVGFIADPRLDVYQRAVLVALAGHANHNLEAWPSYDRIARVSGVSRGLISKCLRALVDTGRIEVLRRSRAKGNRYRVVGTMPKVPDMSCSYDR